MIPQENFQKLEHCRETDRQTDTHSHRQTRPNTFHTAFAGGKNSDLWLFLYMAIVAIVEYMAIVAT